MASFVGCGVGSMSRGPGPVAATLGVANDVTTDNKGSSSSQAADASWVTRGKIATRCCGARCAGDASIGVFAANVEPEGCMRSFVPEHDPHLRPIVLGHIRFYGLSIIHDGVSAFR